VQIPRSRLRAADSGIVAIRANAVGVADACRSAALGFFAGVAEGWSKRDLAEWLGVYQVIAVRSVGSLTASAPDACPARLDEARVRRLMSAVREDAVDIVLALTDPARGVHFGCYAVAAGLVTTYLDQQGTEAWAPVDLPRMRLLDRVRSLIAVDYLLRPLDFRSVVRVCRRCDGVFFDNGRHERAGCGRYGLVGAERARDRANRQDEPRARV